MTDNDPKTIIDRMKADERARLARMRELQSKPYSALSEEEQAEYQVLLPGVSGDLTRGLSEGQLEAGRLADKLTKSETDPEGHETSHRGVTPGYGPRGPDGRHLGLQPQEVQDRYWLAKANEMLNVDSLPDLMDRYGLDPKKPSDKAVGEVHRRYHTEGNPEIKLRLAQELAKSLSGADFDGDEPQKLDEVDPENVFTGDSYRQTRDHKFLGADKKAKGTVIHDRSETPRKY
tara:strand:- start:25 stop:720 length:696 start_codon:yes stop_codon:yes gene_type:complete